METPVPQLGHDAEPIKLYPTIAGGDRPRLGVRRRNLARPYLVEQARSTTPTSHEVAPRPSRRRLGKAAGRRVGRPGIATPANSWECVSGRLTRRPSRSTDISAPRLRGQLAQRPGDDRLGLIASAGLMSGSPAASIEDRDALVRHPVAQQHPASSRTAVARLPSLECTSTQQEPGSTSTSTPSPPWCSGSSNRCSRASYAGNGLATSTTSNTPSKITRTTDHDDSDDLRLSCATTTALPENRCRRW